MKKKPLKCDVCGKPPKGRRRRCTSHDCDKMFGPCCVGDGSQCSACYEKSYWITSAHTGRVGR